MGVLAPIHRLQSLFRSMRVVYGNGRILTLLKFFAISMIYLVLLGITMLAGLAFAMYQVS